jgi:formate hydrogenlyase subunit 6/NADH:ubiquinone oxidoreductase subunit I
VLTKFTIDLGRCMYCGLCVEQCSSDGLHHTGDYENCSRSREDMLLVLYDISTESESANVAAIDDVSPEELREVTDTFGALPTGSEAEPQ